MAKRRVTQQASLDFAFFEALHQFYKDNRGRVRGAYRDLTKRFLDHNDPSKNTAAFLRTPQFEALEMYVFLKEFWRTSRSIRSLRSGVYGGRSFRGARWRSGRGRRSFLTLARRSSLAQRLSCWRRSWRRAGGLMLIIFLR